MRRTPVLQIASLAAAAAIIVAACGSPPAVIEAEGGGWPAYGGDPGGARHSRLAQVDTGNVARLQEAWRYRTGDATHPDHSEGPREGCGTCHTGASKFEATPILADGRLYLSTPLNRVIALDPRHGRELWRFDPKLDLDLERNEGFVSRGVAYARVAPHGACAGRIFFATVDARLFALDAADGHPCPGFGAGGTVRLDQDVGRVQVGQYGVTSPPVVIAGLVVVGSSMGDNRRVDMERGVVRAFDARTGAERWSFDPIPRDARDPEFAHWDSTAARITGAGNAWAPLSVDTALGLVFVPTGSAAPDFYGGLRPGDNRYTNSVVALEARTGAVRWHFQVVHHDLWDFDVGSQPVLLMVPRNGREVPAVAIATKMGHLFVLDRATGAPLFPVEERPVPPSDVPGEVASPTQPFPVLPRPIFGGPLTRDSVWGLDSVERAGCLAQFDRMRSGPLFTPPSLEGTIMFPGYAGGTTWGSLSWAPESHLLVTSQMRIPLYVQLQRRGAPTEGNQRGTPYTMSRAMLASPRGMPCSPPPFGTLVAVDLATGERRWEVPLGRMPELAQVPGSEGWGSVNVGGAITTAGGLVFVGAARDDFLRAYSLATGKELWRGALPAGGQATPMTYAIGGRQYVVIAAGGHGSLGTTFGDYVVAFALP